MKLSLKRTKLTSQITEGELWFNNEFLCYTGEPALKSNRRGKDAIPYGTFELKVLKTQQFGEILAILGCEGRSMMEGDEVPLSIHTGSVIRGSRGCIFVGEYRIKECLYKTVNAMKSLLDYIKKNSFDGDKLEIEIIQALGEENPQPEQVKQIIYSEKGVKNLMC